MQFVPSPEFTFDNPVQAEKLARGCYANGFDDARRLRFLVGANLKEWSVYDQPPGPTRQWNRAGLFVKAYMKHQGSDSWSDAQMNAELRKVVAWWRKSDPDFGVVRNIESQGCHEPSSDTAQMLARLWGAEYLWHLVPPGDEVERGPPELAAWLETACRHTKVAKADFSQQYLRIFERFGESERYSRAHAGITAADIKTVFEETRPHVASVALEEKATEYDLHGACGIITFAIVNRTLEALLRFKWMKKNVFIDIDLMSSAVLQKVRHRTQPWILLHGRVWHVIHRDRAWTTTVALDAIHKWFQCVGGSFWDGQNDYVFARLPSNFPFGK